MTSCTKRDLISPSASPPREKVMRRLCLQPLLQISTTHRSRFGNGRPTTTTTNNRIACLSAECRTRKGALPHHQSRHVSFRCCSRSSKMSSDGSELNSKPSAAAHKPSISFCQSCGGPTKQIVPDGEERTRAVCTLCGRIHYENPKMVVGCLVEHNGKVLLCKRRIQPSHGFWTLPAGFLEIGESALEGAARETLEEACAEVEGLSPFAQIDIPRIGQVYLIFRAKLKKPYFSPGPESLECRLFSLEDIPFDSLAFSSIIVTLRMYAEDIKAGNLKFHYCTISKRPGASMTDPNGFDVDYLLPS